MKKVKFKLDHKGFSELLKSESMCKALEDAGNAVAKAAGAEGEYAVNVHQAKWTAIANVYPNSKDAAKENYEKNTIEKAVGKVGLPRKKSKDL